MKKIDVSRYANELLFHAAVANPWEVGEAEFVAIVAMLTDGSKLSPEERDDIVQFFATACDLAAADAGSARYDVGKVYRQARRTAKRRGYKTHGDPSVSPICATFGLY